MVSVSTTEPPSPSGRSPKNQIQEEYALPEDYTPYIPVAKRRKQLFTKLEARKNKTTEEIQREKEERAREEEDEERIKEKLRRERTLLQQAQEVKERKALEGWSYHLIVSLEPMAGLTT
jgi:ATP-dependent RNA helicase DDX41